MKRSAASQSGSSPGSSATSSIDRPVCSALSNAAWADGKLVLPAAGERVLELVARERLDLREVALGDEAEVRLALLVLLQLLIDDLPSDGLPVFESRERMAEPGRVGPEAAQPAELLSSIRMPEAEPVPSWYRDRSRRRVLAGLDARDQPVASVEAENVARLELRLGRELVHTLLAGPPPRHNEVVEVAVR